MKKLITSLILLLSFTIQAQEYLYSGVAKVHYSDGHNHHLTLTSKSLKEKQFIVKQEGLKVGKDYFFIIKPVKKKGSKTTGVVIFFHEDAAQNTRERNRVLDSIKQPIVNY